MTADDKARLLRWKRDVILATSPATTGNSEDMPLHLIILAMLGLHEHLPRLSKNCLIDANGYVQAVHFPTKSKRVPVILGHGSAILAALNRLADHTKLSDDERTALFLAFKNWVKRDMRADDPTGQRVTSH